MGPNGTRGVRSSTGGYCFGAGLSDIGGEAEDGALFAAAFGGAGGRLVADAGAELVGGGVFGSWLPARLGGDAGGSALTGGTDCADGNGKLGAGAGLAGVLEASGRVRVGQLTA